LDIIYPALYFAVNKRIIKYANIFSAEKPTSISESLLFQTAPVLMKFKSMKQNIQPI